MATLTIIVGYCGSGKSTVKNTLATACPAARVMDEGFAVPTTDRDHRERGAIFQALRDGRSAIVTSLDCASATNRSSVATEVQSEAPGTMILWLFIENDVERANRNCWRDPNRKQDAEGRVAINNSCSGWPYDIPPEAIVLKMYEVPE